MNNISGKENQNTNQTIPPEYQTNEDEFINKLFRKVAGQIRDTHTPILSYEDNESEVWISEDIKKLKWYES